MAAILDLSPSNPSSSNPALLPVYAVLYDFLNDDDEDIRDAASRIGKDILHVSPMIPLVASELLAKQMGEVYGIQMLDLAIGKLVGRGGVQEILDETVKNKGVLFVKEKQNLYVDEVREVELWKGVIENVLLKGVREGKIEGHRAEGSMSVLLRFVRDGLAALNDFRCEGGDGIKEAAGSGDGALGWSTSCEEIFILGWRVYGGLGLVKAWRKIFSAEVDCDQCDQFDLKGMWQEVEQLEKEGEGCGWAFDSTKL